MLSAEERELSARCFFFSIQAAVLSRFVSGRPAVRKAKTRRHTVLEYSESGLKGNPVRAAYSGITTDQQLRRETCCAKPDHRSASEVDVGERDFLFRLPEKTLVVAYGQEEVLGSLPKHRFPSSSYSGIDADFAPGATGDVTGRRCP